MPVIAFVNVGGIDKIDPLIERPMHKTMPIPSERFSSFSIRTIWTPTSGIGWRT